jgi:hypothetical protein
MQRGMGENHKPVGWVPLCGWVYQVWLRKLLLQPECIVTGSNCERRQSLYSDGWARHHHQHTLMRKSINHRANPNARNHSLHGHWLIEIDKFNPICTHQEKK